MKKLPAFIPFLLVAFTCCHGQGKAGDPFVGLNKTQLYQKLGKPAAVKPNGSQGEMLIYKTQQTSQIPGEHYGDKSGGDILVKEQTRTFYLDKKGKVYSWKTS